MVSGCGHVTSGDLAQLQDVQVRADVDEGGGLGRRGVRRQVAVLPRLAGYQVRVLDLILSRELLSKDSIGIEACINTNYYLNHIVRN